MNMVCEGNLVPAVSFADANGDRKALAEFAGKPLILYFYPKDDTSGCTKEAQEFSALIADFGGINAAVVGVSRDSVKSHAKFIGKYDLKIDLASDEDGSLCDAFGVWVEKSMYGKKYMGIERSTFLINADGKIERIWRKVKVPGHAADVLAATKAL
jgi:thioredoxin-dependent peroxiredoxin